MATNDTKGISLRRLQTFLTNLNNIFAKKEHSHSKSQITDFPTIGNGTITVTQNGMTKGSFSLNQTGDVSIVLTDTDTNTTYSTATTSVNGLMSSSDKSKLDGIISGANVKSISISQSAYDALSEKETNVIYFITDAN